MDGDVPAEVVAVNRLLDAFNGLGVSLQLISNGLAALQREAGRYDLHFDAQGQLLGRSWRGTPREPPDCCETRNNELLTVAVGESEQLPKLVRMLYEHHDLALSALSALPPSIRTLLDGLAGKPWEIAVRRDCLDRLLAWPGESGHWRALATKKVPDRPDWLLEAASEFDPHATWQAYQSLLKGYGNDLMALEGHLQRGAAPPAVQFASLAGSMPELPNVNLQTNQVRYRGRCYDVSADGALLFRKLVESHPQAISASTLFSKPSRVKASLPDALQAIVVVEPAKGYRLKLD